MRRFLAAMAVITLLAAGCGDDDDGGSAASTTTEAPVTTKAAGEATALAVETSATNEKSFTAPAEVSGGVVNLTFKNNGKLTHEAALIEIGDKPEDEAVKAFAPVVKEEGSPIPAYIDISGGVFDLSAGQTSSSTLTLPAGRYLIACALTDADSQDGEGGEDQPQLPLHMEQGMRKLLTVTGGTADVSALPKGDGTISAKEYTFDVPTLTAGPKELVFRNDGPKEPHMGVMLEFPAGVDEAGAQKALQAFAQAEEGPPPAGTPEPEDVGFYVSGVKRGGTFRADLKSGRAYALVCFLTDRAGGPPHVAKGMVKTFTVT